MSGTVFGDDGARGAKSTQPIDIHVASRIKLRRLEVAMSAERFAEAMGVTRQQVEKWEKGFSRLTSGRLWEASQVLNINPGWFFDEFFGGAAPAAGSPGTAGMMSAPTVEVVGLWNQLGKKSRDAARRVLRGLVALQQDEEREAELEAARE